MFKSMKYVLQENFRNMFRIYSISKYELLGDFRDSKLGIIWTILNPMIQILTYWLVFGIILTSRNDVDGIPYICWLLGGIVAWFFVSPCITNGCNAIFSKVSIITKMKFPVSILPMTVVLKELFNHLCLMLILVFLLAIFGYYPSLEWFGLLYYLFCAIIFSACLSLVTSVLNMLARDTRKMIMACMRLILYLTPILWSMDLLKHHPTLRILMKFNPIHYIVQGYRDCFFYHQGIMAYVDTMIPFWVITFILFAVGSFMMYKFKHKLIDMI